MDFEDFFNFKLETELNLIDQSKFKKKWQLSKQFKRFIEKEEHTDYLEGVFAGILFVITETQINLDSVQKYEKFSKKPLKGLRKVPVVLPNIRSLAKNGYLS